MIRHPCAAVDAAANQGYNQHIDDAIIKDKPPDSRQVCQ